MKNTISPKNFLFFAGLFIIAYMPLFSFLDHLPIRLWDESRNAMNAIEMFLNKKYLIVTYGNEPDLWNTKPPLLTWIQVMFFHLLGITELAVRLPSAISGFLTCCILFFFGRQYLNNTLLGLISVLVLVTSMGYIDLHSTRTGDYDALLTLWTTSAAVSLFLFLELRKTKYWYIFVLSLALAALTKGIAGLLFTPAYLLFILYKRQLMALLKNRHLYLGLLIFFTLVGAFYIGREVAEPGYLKAVYENELGGRFLDSLDDHNFPTDFYLENLFNLKYSYWIWCTIAGMFIGMFWKDPGIRTFNIFSIMLIVVHFTLISTAGTKLIWYDVPNYPFLAFHCALPIVFILDLLKKQEILKIQWGTEILMLLFVIIIFVSPYSAIVKKVYKAKEINEYGSHSYDIGYYLKRAMKNNQAAEMEGTFVLYDEHHAHILFYIFQYQYNGIDLTHQYYPNLKAGDRALTDRQRLKTAIEEMYTFEILDSYRNAQVYKITGTK